MKVDSAMKKSAMQSLAKAKEQSYYSLPYDPLDSPADRRKVVERLLGDVKNHIDLAHKQKKDLLLVTSIS